MKRQNKLVALIFTIALTLSYMAILSSASADSKITQKEYKSVLNGRFSGIENESDKAVVVEALPEGSLPYSFDIDMPIEHQQYAMAMCEEYGIDVDIFFSLMYHESRYTVDAFNGSDYGYCQINKVNWKWLANDYGLNVKNPLDNIESGTLMLSAYLTKANGDYAHALTGYNTGSVKYANEYAGRY